LYQELHVLEKYLIVEHTLYEQRKKLGYFTGKVAYCHEKHVMMAGLGK
jgi:hypothetical protein